MTGTTDGIEPRSKKMRLKLLVDRDVQGALARQLCFHWLSLAFCLFVATAAVHVLSNPLERADVQMANYWNQNAKIFVILALVTPAFIWDALKLSNRFAGPIFRLRPALKALGDGKDGEELKFRQGDFWQDIAASFNRTRDRLLDAERASGADQDDADRCDELNEVDELDEQEALV